MPELTDEEKMRAMFAPVETTVEPKVSESAIVVPLVESEIKEEVEKPLTVEKFEEIINEVLDKPILKEEELERMFRLQTELSSKKQRILMLCHASGMDSMQQLRFIQELHKILSWE